MAETTVVRECDGARTVFRLAGFFDRSMAWSLREEIAAEKSSLEILLDFSLVRDFSDLAVAILAHGLTRIARRVAFRGLRQHQVRILRYCGVAVDEPAARLDPAAGGGPTERRPS